MAINYLLGPQETYMSEARPWINAKFYQVLQLKKHISFKPHIMSCQDLEIANKLALFLLFCL